MNPLDLDRQVTKVSMAMMTRNRQIVADIIADLRTQVTPAEVAGIILIGLERLLWFETDLVVWIIENLIPIDIRLEIKNMISVNTYKWLIGKGLVPGKDFSLDANGKLLQKCKTAHSS
jgi:hypothetical protein